MGGGVRARPEVCRELIVRDGSASQRGRQQRGAAGQTVEHAHVHIIPRRPAMSPIPARGPPCYP